MHRFALLVALLAGVGCNRNVRSITTDAVLGRVVIYRNGVAFYERTARVVDGRVTVMVPRERVDDFLKSLTVVDPTTRKPLAVSIPRQEAESGSYLTMSLETQDRSRSEVLLTYVTESPAWKPSYRVVVGSNDKVMLEGWAIVDNVSGEDWKGVLVGVGASSALSFRYDLWSVRHVDRDLLAGDESFAVAPPTGMSPFAGGEGDAQEIATLQGDEIRNTNVAVGSTVDGDGPATKPAATRGDASIAGVVKDEIGDGLGGATVIVTSPSLAQTQTALTDDKGRYSITGLPAGDYLVTFYYANRTIERPGVRVAAKKQTSISQKIDTSAVGGETIRIAGAPPTIDPSSTTQGITMDKNYIKNVPVPGRTYESAIGAAPGGSGDGAGVTFSGSSSLENQYYVDGVNTTGLTYGTSGSGSGYKPPPPPPPIRVGDQKLKSAAESILKNRQDVLVEAGGLTETEALQRAQGVKNKLVDDGIPATRIRIRPQVGNDNRVRVLAINSPASSAGTNGARPDMPDTPVGESHFMAERPMNVKRGTSAMVSMVRSETKGGIVYLYDPLSDRGDDRFAFKAVRLDNPTDDTLEPGPVTVYGDGRFIGEGITEPVPPKASVVVPFALDRQILISRNETESDRIAKILTVQRGIVTAELQHRRTEKFTITSRLRVPTKVYLRHRLQSGWTLVESPDHHMTVGDSKLFSVDLGPNETKYVTIAEATPVQKQLDLASEHPLEMMKLYVDEPEASPKLRAQIAALLATHRDAVDLVDKIGTLRDQLGEYRQRTGELHAQLVTLKAVKTGGELMTQLKQRLAEMNERMQKSTIAIVDAQEKLMLARVKFANQLADLKLTDVTEAVSTR